MEIPNPEGPMLDPEHGNDQIIWNLNLLEQVLAHPTVDVVKTISGGARRQELRRVCQRYYRIL